jgi:PTH1 family peptidyl-tRNA hydrolase
MKLIVGLGNPGRQYLHTPHNAGFEVIDELARRQERVLRRSFRFRARTGKGTIAGYPVLLVQPVAFMNNSGPVVASMVNKLGVAVRDLIVIADDADLPEGQLRIRAQGSSGGHKGMQSILDHLGQDQFVRVRFGIGRSRDQADLVAHVLRPWSAAAWQEMEPTIRTAADAVGFLLEHGVEAAMNNFNARR